MEVDDFELLELVNDYQERSDEPTFNTLDDIPEDLMYIIKHYPYKHKMHVVSEERIREELTKCFKCNTVETLEFLHDIPRLRDYIFERTNLWLKPTNEK